MTGTEGQAKSGSDLLRIEAGKVVFSEGDPGSVVFVVLDGKVELRVAGRLVETVGPGGILGEMALIEHAPRVATATAKVACDLLPISEERFGTMIQQTPSFALQIMKVMAGRLRKMNERIARKKPAAKKAVRKKRAPSARPRAARRRSSRR